MGSWLPVQGQEELTKSTGHHQPVASLQPRWGSLQLPFGSTRASQAHGCKVTISSWIYVVATQSYAWIMANTACGPEPRGTDVWL